MLEPETKRAARYWDNVTDDQLLDIELTTDDPEGLDGLVFELPRGEEDPYVEFKYDLRKSGRDKLRCVECGTPHLAGFVMRQGASRFLIGHICGRHVYGEDFQGFTSDFTAAQNRQGAIRKVYELRTATTELMTWLTSVGGSEVFKLLGKLRGEFREQLPWIYDNIDVILGYAKEENGPEIPKAIFSDLNPRDALARIVEELRPLHDTLSGNAEAAAAALPRIRPRLDGVLKQLDRLLDYLGQPVEFFQPQVLMYVADVATDCDNPNKRTYEAGLMSITCKKNRDRPTVSLPTTYSVPTREPMERLRKVLMAA
jgi:hypothetical protein